MPRIKPIQDWVWNATVIRWIDGDSLVLSVDRGFRSTQIEVIRLVGINTPELVGYESARAHQAKVLCEQISPNGSNVIIRTYKNKDKYGRWLAEIWCGEQCVNDALLAAGLAVEMK